MKQIVFFIIILFLSCENPFYRKKKFRPVTEDNASWLYALGVLGGCFNSKTPDYCGQSNSVKLIRPEDTKCGLRVISSSPYIYNESGKQVLTDSITGIQKLQCKNIDKSLYIAPGYNRWYKEDANTSSLATLIFTHTRLSDKSEDFFFNYSSGDSLLCCYEYYVDKPSCKEPYWEIECNRLKIQ